jgi:predicted GH43/DUF377 family glycosyl hydrolase
MSLGYKFLGLIFLLLLFPMDSQATIEHPGSRAYPGKLGSPSDGNAGGSFPCENPGWFPEQFGLKDHTVFQYDGLYYLASIYLSDTDNEQQFAYASSPDLCQWTDLGGILRTRRPGSWDEYRIWAPFVYEEDGIYYMYYTGVTGVAGVEAPRPLAQSIMLATTADPSDPDSWKERGVVFQPDHDNMIWSGFDTWSDCRDATVIQAGNLYYLYYTGLDYAPDLRSSVGIVGLASSTSPLGPWLDQGAVLRLPGAMPESPTVAVHEGVYYLFYNHAGAEVLGGMERHGPAPAGPWTEASPFRPGWAHEVWSDLEGETNTSYLTDYSVTIQRLTWDSFYDPPRPFIGETIYRIFAPLATR